MNVTEEKIINDPVFGFITIPNDFVYTIIQHPFLQRLNRIRQLGLALLYILELNTRFHHSIGAMFLMGEALKTLHEKGHTITNDEWNGALAAILMHDIGHGPFSHVLEHTLVTHIQHETLSLLMMQK